MKIVGDLHTHTIASSHAYSTIQDNAVAAARKGLEIIAMTDHGPGMEDGAHPWHFGCLYMLPGEIQGVKVLKGCEANIVDFDGNIDLKEEFMQMLEYVIASYHHHVFKAGTIEQNTNAYIAALKNKYVDALGHAIDPRFPFDFEMVVKAAKEYNKIIEINNAALVKFGEVESWSRLLLLCKEYGVKVATSSDAHFSESIGRLDAAIQLLEEIEMPEELVVTTSKEKLLEHLRSHGRNV